MAPLLIATKNAHKTEELRALLGPGWQVQDLNAYPEIAAPEETGETFAENAAIKALAAAALFPGLVLADDSGWKWMHSAEPRASALRATRARTRPMRLTARNCCGTSPARPTGRRGFAAYWSLRGTGR